MAYKDTILKQLITNIPRYEFDALAEQHHSGQKFRSCNCWSQFLAMVIAQLSGRKSLRDVTENLKIQEKRLYHLGMKKTSKATLARVNAKQPASLYQVLFNRLLKRCQLVAPKHKFSFKGKLYLLDATTINLCLSAFPWAEFRQKKGGIKLNVGLDADGYLWHTSGTRQQSFLHFTCFFTDRFLFGPGNDSFLEIRRDTTFFAGCRPLFRESFCA